MKTPTRPVMTVLAMAAALGGCANLGQEGPRAMRIEPVLRISSGSNSGTLGGYLALARQYEGEGRWLSAAEALRQAVALDPRNPDTLNQLGHAEAMLKRYPAAIVAFETAVALAPERVDLLNNLGYTLMLDKRPALAGVVLTLALQRAPDYAAARANLQLADIQVAELRAAQPVANAPLVASTEPALSAQASVPALIAVATIDAAPTPTDSSTKKIAAPVLQTDTPLALVNEATAVAARDVSPLSSTALAAIAPLPRQVLPATGTQDSPPIDTDPAPRIAHRRFSGPDTHVLASTPALMDQEPIEGSLSQATSIPLVVMSAPNVPPLSVASLSVIDPVPPQQALPVAVPQASAPVEIASAPQLARTRVVVLNGNGVTGAAARLGKRLTEMGLSQPRLANLLPYRTETTTVQYQAGFAQQARAIARLLPMSSLIERAAAGTTGEVRVIIGHDVAYTQACTLLAAACRTTQPVAQVSSAKPSAV